VADSSAAIRSAAAVAQQPSFAPGTYQANSGVTIDRGVVFAGGAILRPASGVTVKLGAAFHALATQIFDCSQGGWVQIPRMAEVWGEWWGAKGDGVKANNEVPINLAAQALRQGSGGGGYGGTVLLDRGYFAVQGAIYLSDNISIRGRGMFYTDIFAVPGWAEGDTCMILGQNAAALRFTAPLAAGSTAATLTTAWQGATGAHVVVFFESSMGAMAKRTATLTHGSAEIGGFSSGLARPCAAEAFALLATPVDPTGASMFNSRVEQLRLDAKRNGGIAAVIHGPAWQQKCGTDNVYIDGFKGNGIQLDSGYGGAAQVKIRRTEVNAAGDCLPGSACIRMNYPASLVGWISVDLDEVDTSSGVANLAASTGVWATGRVIVNVSDLHAEQQGTAVRLDTAATVVGTSLTADGAATVTTLIHCARSWTGTVNMRAVERGGAANFIVDESRGPYALANAPGTAGYPGSAAGGGGGYSQQVVWPPDPAIPVLAMMLTVSGGTVTVHYCSGGLGASQALTVARSGTGTYVYTFAVPHSMDGVNLYDVMASSDCPQTAVSRTSATKFTVTTRNGTGELTDPTSIGVRVYHAP
jgi:hypothetical protein